MRPLRVLAYRQSTAGTFAQPIRWADFRVPPFDAGHVGRLRNAPLTETGRLRLARCVVDERWPLRRAAERFNVSVTTARRCALRHRADGQAGMGDRSSRPFTARIRPHAGGSGG